MAEFERLPSYTISAHFTTKYYEIYNANMTSM